MEEELQSSLGFLEPVRGGVLPRSQTASVGPARGGTATFWPWFYLLSLT